MVKSVNIAKKKIMMICFAIVCFSLVLSIVSINQYKEESETSVATILNSYFSFLPLEIAGGIFYTFGYSETITIPIFMTIYYLFFFIPSFVYITKNKKIYLFIQIGLIAIQFLLVSIFWILVY